ncbi:MAG: tRNA (N(6)-L-threonylcarbamoyladenosine(37)-C(2))-methylthiotransferase MtaB [Nitrospirota bacterium]
MRVAFKTLGCKINQFDTAVMEEIIKENKHLIVSFEEAADVYIINTCSVTKRGDYQSRQMIRRSIRQNSSAKIIATGCYVQTNPEEIGSIPGVDILLGNDEKLNILDYINSIDSSISQSKVSPPQKEIGDISATDKFRYHIIKGFLDKTRGFVKIQDGCNSFCSYCIVPMARGRSRSLSPDKVIEQIKTFEEEGYREIVLTGVHLGSYGMDLEPAFNLSELLNQILSATSVSRIRLSSIDPTDINDDLIDILAASHRICRHLHIPLQSGDDRILKEMNRGYSSLYYNNLIVKLKQKLPEICIGTDIMAGFPGEDNNSFITTCRFIESLPISYIHVFSYSKRPGTMASKMRYQITREIKDKRNRVLRELSKKKREVFYKRFIDRELSVLIEDKRDKNGLLKGLSDNYIRVFLEGDDNFKDKIVNLKIISLLDDGLIGVHED